MAAPRLVDHDDVDGVLRVSWEQLAAADRRLRRNCLEPAERAALAELLGVLAGAVRTGRPCNGCAVELRFAQAVRVLARGQAQESSPVSGQRRSDGNGD